MSASALEARFTEAVQDGDFPGVVLVAKSVDGAQTPFIGHLSST
jgi:hypothetical protein